MIKRNTLTYSSIHRRWIMFLKQRRYIFFSKVFDLTRLDSHNACAINSESINLRDALSRHSEQKFLVSADIITSHFLFLVTSQLFTRWASNPKMHFLRLANTVNKTGIPDYVKDVVVRREASSFLLLLNKLLLNCTICEKEHCL